MLEQILPEIAKSFIPSIAVNSAYDILKYIAKELIKDQSDGYFDEDLLNNIYKAIDKVSDDFFAAYGDSFGKPSSSFLASKSNIELIIKSFYYDEYIDLDKELDKRGFDEAPEVSKEALSWFVEQFYMGARKYQNLNKIITEKEHFLLTQKMDQRLKEVTNIKRGLDFDYAKVTLPRNEVVIGREKEAAEVAKLVEEGKKVINILGIPGVGRKALCRYYINTYRNNSDVFWINYDGDLKSSFIKLFGNAISEQDNINMIISELNSNPKYQQSVLVVSDFNNIHDENLKILFQLKLTVIITSCKNFDCDFVEDYGLPTLNDDLCRDLFLYYHVNSETCSKEELLELIHLCGNHTMSIKLLAKTAKANNLSINELLVHLQEVGFNLNQIAPRPVENVAYYALFLEHLEKLFYWTNLGETELDLLTQLSILPCQGVEESIIYALNYEYKTIEKLILNGFIEEYDNILVMHNVIQQVIVEKTKPNFEKCSKIINYILTNEYKCLYYGSSILNWIDECNETTVLLCIHVGISFGKYYLYKNALEYFLLAEEKNKVIPNPKEYKFIICANKACMHFVLGNYGEAYNNITIAYPNFWNVIKGEKENDLSILSSATMIFNQYGEYQKAERSYRKALKIYKNKGCPNKMLIFALYNNIAKLYVNQKLYEKAEGFYIDAKAILDKYIQNNSRCLATWYFNYSILLNEMKSDNLHKAEKYLNKALEISMNGEIKDNLFIGNILKELGVHWIARGNYTKAENYFKQALRAINKIEFSNCIEKGKLYYDLGRVYYYMKDYQQSRYYYLEAEKLFKAGVLPEGHIFFRRLYEAMNAARIASVYSRIAIDFEKQK